MYNAPNPYYGHKRNKNGTYLSKLSKQLASVLIILLCLMLLKYIKSEKITILNSRVKEIFNDDYTKQTVDVFMSKSPDISELLDRIFGKRTPKDQFKLGFMPVEGKITSPYGNRINPISKKQEAHKGIDIDAKVGSPVKAVMDGKVESIENSQTYGMKITIDHGNEYKTVYAHMSEIKVSEGDEIKAGDIIGLSGNTGMSTGPHLHFEVQRYGKDLDPLSCFKASVN